MGIQSIYTTDTTNPVLSVSKQYKLKIMGGYSEEFLLYQIINEDILTQKRQMHTG